MENEIQSTFARVFHHLKIKSIQYKEKKKTAISFGQKKKF